jgi:hypothetical protein
MNPRQTDWDADEREALEGLQPELEAMRERHGDGPPLEVLRAHRAGVLPEALGDAVGAHLDRSPWSVALAEGADAAEPALDPSTVNRLLTGLNAEATLPSASRSISSRRHFALAAAVGVTVAGAVAGFVYMVAVSRHGPGEAKPPASATGPVAAVRPSTPAFSLALEKPDVKLTARALVLRGDGNRARFIDDIAPALAAYRANDFATAAREFSRLHDRYPDAVEVSFYLGISRLFLGDGSGAVSALEAARRSGDDTFNDDIRWYLAVGYERAGEGARARLEVDALCRGQTAYTARACEAVRRLSGQRAPEVGR